jgi:glycosyltransferase involved in cell wall biosynthesis
VKRLLVFTEVYNRGGGNRYMTDLVNGVSENYEEVLIASNRGGLYPEDARRLNRPFASRMARFVTRAQLGNYIRGWPAPLRKAIGVPLVPLEPLFFLFNVLLFWQLLRHLKPSRVLSCNGGYPAAAACLAMVFAARLSNLPVALSIVSVPTVRRPYLWLYEKSIDWLVWRAVDLVIVNARAIADALCEIRGMPSDKFAVIHNGLEERPGLAVRDSRNDHVVIGCIARMDIAKGALVLFDAFAALARLRPNLRLVLAGHGDASAELARRTESLGLQGRVELLGHYGGDVDALLSRFDLYVFPSLWEGFPYSIVEAMRAGVPIVATRVGGIPEAIADGKDGLLVEPDSRDAMIGAIARLLDDPDLRRSLGRNARLKYENSLSLDKMHLRVREVFAAHQF